MKPMTIISRSKFFDKRLEMLVNISVSITCTNHTLEPTQVSPPFRESATTQNQHFIADCELSMSNQACVITWKNRNKNKLCLV